MCVGGELPGDALNAISGGGRGGWGWSIYLLCFTAPPGYHSLHEVWGAAFTDPRAAPFVSLGIRVACNTGCLYFGFLLPEGRGRGNEASFAVPTCLCLCAGFLSWKGGKGSQVELCKP